MFVVQARDKRCEAVRLDVSQRQEKRLDPCGGDGEQRIQAHASIRCLLNMSASSTCCGVCSFRDVFPAGGVFRISICKRMRCIYRRMLVLGSRRQAIGLELVE
jgi:hypothetical protein